VNFVKVPGPSDRNGYLAVTKSQGKLEVRRLRIRLRFFASFRDRIGDSEIWIEVDEGTDLDGFSSIVRQRYSFLVEGLVAINGRYMDPDTMLKDGDEVAFFPPVSGG
jgi:molybdopterin synthase sulfur carrier subunit